MNAECDCHPECQTSCRVEQHDADDPCIWPDCLTVPEMRAILKGLHIAGDIEPSDY
jgi:hypothetical protein